jgi:hypothetical protein
MMGIRSVGKVALGITVFALAGCAATPKLADYPRREIDRPVTLPKGVTSWGMHGSYSVERYRFDYTGERVTDQSVYAAIPSQYQTSLSDEWNLVWYPIPIAAIYSIRNDSAATTGLTLGYGFRFSNYGNTAAELYAAYFHRQKLTPDFAIEFSPSLAPWIPIGENAKWDLQASLGVGPFVQIGEFLAARAGMRAVLRRDSTTVMSGDLFSSKGLDITTTYTWRMVYPLYAGLNWSVGRQWDIGGTLEYQKLGEANDYSNFQVAYELRHFW